MKIATELTDYLNPHKLLPMFYSFSIFLKCSVSSYVGKTQSTSHRENCLPKNRIRKTERKIIRERKRENPKYVELMKLIFSYPSMTSLLPLSEISEMFQLLY